MYNKSVKKKPDYFPSRPSQITLATVAGITRPECPIAKQHDGGGLCATDQGPMSKLLHGSCVRSYSKLACSGKHINLLLSTI